MNNHNVENNFVFKDALSLTPAPTIKRESIAAAINLALIGLLLFLTGIETTWVKIVGCALIGYVVGKLLICAIIRGKSSE